MDRSSSRARRVLRLLLGAVAVLAVAAAGSVVAVYLLFLRDLPDFQSLEDQAVTLRDRETMAQIRVPIADLPSVTRDKLEHSW